ncbi:MAG: hypothetical protein ACOYB3_01940 [Azonexus sp.]
MWWDLRWVPWSYVGVLALLVGVLPALVYGLTRLPHAFDDPYIRWNLILLFLTGGAWAFVWAFTYSARARRLRSTSH